VRERGWECECVKEGGYVSAKRRVDMCVPRVDT